MHFFFAVSHLALIPPHLEQGRDAPEGGDILVLLADGFTQAIDLEMAGLLREFAGL